MGLSFHDESSMVEASIGSVRFGRPPDNWDPNPMPENRIVDEEWRHDDFEIQLSDSGLDIQMVNR